ncbi:unnamed protein product [Brassica oleracea]
MKPILPARSITPREDLEFWSKTETRPQTCRRTRRREEEKQNGKPEPREREPPAPELTRAQPEPRPPDAEAATEICKLAA